VSPRTGMFSFWQPRGNIRADLAAAMSPMSIVPLDDL
jgi:hypothetical protein